MSTTDGDLAGVGVLVTRPAHQAANLAEAIEARGGTVVRFPVIEIVPRDPAEIDKAAAEIGAPDIVIFVSPNAVRYGGAVAANARIAAVGPATAAAVAASGMNVTIRSETGYDSEHLLEEPELVDVAGKTVHIVRGASGRELIAETLRERGATVEYLPVYDRDAPEYSATQLAELEELWRTRGIDIVTVMSVESLANLVALLPEWCGEQLRATPLVTPAERVIKEARNRFPGIPATLAGGPQSQDMVDAIVEVARNLSGKTR